MVEMTEKERLKYSEKRHHERFLQEQIMNSDRTDEEKYNILKGRLNWTGLYRKVFKFYEWLKISLNK